MNDERGGITTSSNRLRRPATRREFLKRSIAVAGAAALPAFVPGRALGLDGAVAPSRRIVLGAIGIGPRGSHVLGCFLAEPDVQFVAICDVRADRRQSVKATADAKYGNKDCAMYRDMFELLGRPDIDAVPGLRERRLAGLLRFRFGSHTPGLGRPYRGPVPSGQPGGPDHAGGVRG